MKIHQLFDDATSTYTYVLVDTATGEAAIVDPVRERSERDLAFLHEHQLTLSWIAETHVHADHITGAGTLRQQTGATIVVGEDAAVPCADRQLQDGEPRPWALMRFKFFILQVIPLAVSRSLSMTP